MTKDDEKLAEACREYNEAVAKEECENGQKAAKAAFLLGVISKHVHPRDLIACLSVAIAETVAAHRKVN